MPSFKQEYKVENVYREVDDENKEKYAVLELLNAKDENLLNSTNIIVSNIEALIRKN